MKVNSMLTPNTQRGLDREPVGRTERADGQFAADLSKSKDDMSQQRLSGLLDQITAQGNKLGTAPTYGDLKAYRELVRSFLGEVVGRAYTLHSETGWDRKGRQKMYSTIKEIDSHLAALTEEVRGGQEKQLSVMARLDAIRGMLVDLYG